MKIHCLILQKGYGDTGQVEGILKVFIIVTMQEKGGYTNTQNGPITSRDKNRVKIQSKRTLHFLLTCFTRIFTCKYLQFIEERFKQIQ